jgi:hypothetical protein
MHPDCPEVIAYLKSLSDTDFLCKLEHYAVEFRRRWPEISEKMQLLCEPMEQELSLTLAQNDKGPSEGALTTGET